MLRWPRRVSLVNARVLTPDGLATSIRFSSRVLSLDEPPRNGDVVVDLGGDFVLPGLINAHDHLELNHYGRLKRRDRYDNASEWIADLRPALRHDPAITAGRAVPLADRLLVGALKNLLAGVTTVAHHNPFYRELGGASPLRVLRRFGWAHSFAMEREPVGANGEPGGSVRDRYARTHTSLPFIVHAGEGVDAAAEDDLLGLDRAGCLGANTVVVHGVALSAPQWQRMAGRGASLVWCPASNHYLFARSAPVRALLDAAPAAADQICLGSDSRVTGARDLLDELRAAASCAPIAASDLLRMVTTSAAKVLKLRDAGALAWRKPADLIVVPAAGRETPGEALLALARRDLRLVVVGGRPQLAAAEFADVFVARGTQSAAVTIDGSRRLANARIVRAVARSSVAEQGVACG